MTDHYTLLKDLLLEDYRYRAEALRKSEQAGETRLNIFMALIAGAASALVAMVNAEHGPKGDLLRLIMLVVLGSLLAVGWMTFARLIIRDERTDECKRDLDHIRQAYKDCFDQDGILAGYQPVSSNGRGAGNNPQLVGAGLSASQQDSLPNRNRSFGGLVHFMAAMNSLLLACAIVGLMVPQAPPDGGMGWKLLVATFVLAGLGFMGGMFLHIGFKRRRAHTYASRLDKESVTHAGGVVFKREGEGFRYLILSSRQGPAEQWVLPKGHIEQGETYQDAALREVAEEAGVLVRVLGYLGLICFPPAASEDMPKVIMKCYLMEWLVDAPELSGERRKCRWLSFTEAIQALTFTESKRLLLLAHAKNSQ